MIIIGVDPGKGTGMARYSTETGKMEAIEVFDRVQVGSVLKNWITLTHHPLVAVERYIMLPKMKTPQPDALMIMGSLEFICQTHTSRPTFMWQTIEMKNRISNDMLWRLGWYVRSKDGHANDAMRHVLVAFAQHDPEGYAALVGI